MKKRKMLACAAVSAICVSNTLAAGTTATISLQPIYVDGQRIFMAAYTIESSNYVMLRNIGSCVDFNVSYDAATDSIHIDPDSSYVEVPMPVVPDTGYTVSAIPTTQNIYVNGQPMAITAYSINNNNYVKLRDIGKAVNFDVQYDAANDSVYIHSDKPYEENKSSDSSKVSTVDYSAEANPEIFTEDLPRGYYNAIRYTWLNREMLSDYLNSNGKPFDDPNCMFTDYPQNITKIGDIDHALTGGKYNIGTSDKRNKGYMICGAGYRTDVRLDNPRFKAVIDHARQIASETERVKYINDAICEGMTYSTDRGGFEKGKGVCQDYAEAFDLIARASDLLTFCQSGPDHLWNVVYADGKWGIVDVTNNDIADNPAHRDNYLLLPEHPTYSVDWPERTKFLKEILVPGSTK